MVAEFSISVRVYMWTHLLASQINGSSLSDVSLKVVLAI